MRWFKRLFRGRGDKSPLTSLVRIVFEDGTHVSVSSAESVSLRSECVTVYGSDSKILVPYRILKYIRITPKDVIETMTSDQQTSARAGE